MEGEILDRYVRPLSSLVELSIRISSPKKGGILRDSLNRPSLTQNLIAMKCEVLSDTLHLTSLEVLSIGNFSPMDRGIFNDIFYQPLYVFLFTTTI